MRRFECGRQKSQRQFDLRGSRLALIHSPIKIRYRIRRRGVAGSLTPRRQCASLIRQFEFAQNVWANDRNFHELGNERDPIIGAQDGTLEYKIPKRPIRKKITGLPAFTTVKGGAYFFLPGIKALRYLATLDDVR